MTPSQTAARPRWPYVPGQGRLLLAAVLLLVGPFLPWINLLGATPNGFQGTSVGQVVLGAGGIALAGSVVWKRVPVVVGHAVVAGLLGLVFPALQGAILLSVASDAGGLFQGIAPGTGMVVILFGGGLALSAAWKVWQGRRQA